MLVRLVAWTVGGFGNGIQYAGTENQTARCRYRTKSWSKFWSEYVHLWFRKFCLSGSNFLSVRASRAYFVFRKGMRNWVDCARISVRCSIVTTVQLIRRNCRVQQKSNFRLSWSKSKPYSVFLQNNFATLRLTEARRNRETEEEKLERDFQKTMAVANQHVAEINALEKEQEESTRVMLVKVQKSKK